MLYGWFNAPCAQCRSLTCLMCCPSLATCGSGCCANSQPARGTNVMFPPSHHHAAGVSWLSACLSDFHWVSMCLQHVQRGHLKRAQSGKVNEWMNEFIYILKLYSRSLVCRALLQFVTPGNPLLSVTARQEDLRSTQTGPWRHQRASGIPLLLIYLAALGPSCGMRDLVPWPGIEPKPPALEVQSLSHWIIREVPQRVLLSKRVLVQKD